MTNTTDDTAGGGARPLPMDARAYEVLVALLRSLGGAAEFDAEYMLTTSTRAPGGRVRAVLYEPRGTTVRLSLPSPPHPAPGVEPLFGGAAPSDTAPGAASWGRA